MAHASSWAFLSDPVPIDTRPGPDGAIQFHATSLSVDGAAVMLAGASGAGKSSLALRCIALGAQLISDDITWVSKDLIACGPETLAGRIEIRGIGILNAAAAPPAPLALVVDMGETETERLPAARTICIHGQDVDLLHKAETPYFAEAILHYMRHGRHDGA